MGRIRIGYMDFAINGRLPWLLKGFRAKYPLDIVDLEYGPSARQKTAILEGRLDIGFVISQLESQKMRNVLVEENDYVALLPDLHPLASREQLRLADLADEPFVMGSEDTFSSFRGLLFPICHSVGFFPTIVQQASSTSGILGMVAAGVGVSVYAGCVRNLMREGVVVRALVDVPDRIPTYAVWVDDHPSEVVRRFGEFLALHAARQTPR